jgi:hypothetical protein
MSQVTNVKRIYLFKQIIMSLLSLYLELNTAQLETQKCFKFLKGQNLTQKLTILGKM